MKCFLIVGLGNPEGRYFNTWHHLGFKAAEETAANFVLMQKSPFKKRGNQLLAEAKVGDSRVFILKPLTYMNLSGQAVLAVARKYKIPAENIIVFADDVYIDIGHIRITTGGGSGGHNGIQSISELLKSANYIKIRIGAKPAKDIKGNTADYVLSKIPDELLPQVTESLNLAAAAATEIITDGGIDAVKGKYNSKNTVGNTVGK